MNDSFPFLFSARLRIFLEHCHLWSNEDEKTLRVEARQTLLASVKEIQTKKTFPILPGLFDDVYDKQPWNIAVSFICRKVMPFMS